MASIREYYPGSNSLRAEDLDPRQDLVLTIQGIEIQTFQVEGKPDETKPVLYFDEDARTLVLNKTNAFAIADFLGDETDDWHGQQIALYRTTVAYNGKQVPCIRVRRPAPVSQSRPAPAPAPAPGPRQQAPAPQRPNGPAQPQRPAHARPQRPQQQQAVAVDEYGEPIPF